MRRCGSTITFNSMPGSATVRTKISSAAVSDYGWGGSLQVGSSSCETQQSLHGARSVGSREELDPTYGPIIWNGHACTRADHRLGADFGDRNQRGRGGAAARSGSG